MQQIYFLNNAEFGVIIPPTLTFSVRLLHTMKTFVQQTLVSTPRTTLAISLSENVFLTEKIVYSLFYMGVVLNQG